MAKPDLEYKDFFLYEGKSRDDMLVKDVTDQGNFSGYLSVFGVEDAVKDIVEPGAFARTLHHKGGKFPFLWQHEEPIGGFTAKEDSTGLHIKGAMVMDVQRAREGRALAKAGVVTGLSIGYKIVKDDYDRASGVRRLKELNLWEGSLVTFPCCAPAQLTQMKRARSYLEELMKDDDGLMKATATLLRARKDTKIPEEEFDAVRFAISREYKMLGRCAPWDENCTLKELAQHVKELSRFSDRPNDFEDLLDSEGEDVHLNPLAKVFDWMDQAQELDLEVGSEELKNAFDWMKTN